MIGIYFLYCRPLLRHFPDFDFKSCNSHEHLVASYFFSLVFMMNMLKNKDFLDVKIFSKSKN